MALILEKRQKEELGNIFVASWSGPAWGLALISAPPTWESTWPSTWLSSWTAQHKHFVIVVFAHGSTECLPEVFQHRLASSQRSVVYLFKNLPIQGANLQIWAHQDSPTKSSRTLGPGLQMKSVNSHSTLFGICSISLSLPSWNSLIPSISHATST